MVRLVGFVVLAGLVMLVLQVASQRRPEPEPITSTATEPEIDVQVHSVPEAEMSLAEGESEAAPAQEATLSVPTERVATSAGSNEAPSPSPPHPQDRATDPFGAALETAPQTAGRAVDDREDTGGGEEDATALAHDIAPAPMQHLASAPVSAHMPEPAPALAPEVPSPATSGTESPSAEPYDSGRTTATGTPPGEPARIEQRLIADEHFVALEQAQGRTDERTDAQRQRQERDGWYGWGVLNEYADPDRAARLLGGVAMVRTGGRFLTLREHAGRVQVRPLVNVSAAYGAVALRAQDAALAQHLRRALNAGLLLGREADHELWYLFPRREAAHIGNKVVQVFECHLRARGLRGEAADRFRAQAKLRGAVLALGRANGGRLGVFLPRYFRIEGERVPVAAPCRVLDDESRPIGFASANPPGVP